MHMILSFYDNQVLLELAFLPQINGIFYYKVLTFHGDNGKLKPLFLHDPMENLGCHP